MNFSLCMRHLSKAMVNLQVQVLNPRIPYSPQMVESSKCISIMERNYLCPITSKTIIISQPPSKIYQWEQGPRVNTTIWAVTLAVILISHISTINKTQAPFKIISNFWNKDLMLGKKDFENCLSPLNVIKILIFLND